MAVNGLPDWMPWPAAPRPRRWQPPLPHVIGQAPQGDGTVRVTFALPGLRRLTVSVPQSEWLEGHHLTIGREAHKVIDSWLPPMLPDSDEPEA